jgi:hypothetical protein
MACSGGGCGGCKGPPDPIESSRETWRAWLFLMALAGVLVVFASR